MTGNTSGGPIVTLICAYFVITQFFFHQAKLLSLSRTPQNKVEMSRSKSPTIRSPSRSPPLQRKREVPPKPITKTTVPQLGHGEYHQEWFQEQQSPETPKPRTNPPKPLSFEFKSKKQPSGRGSFL